MAPPGNGNGNALGNGNGPPFNPPGPPNNTPPATPPGQTPRAQDDLVDVLEDGLQTGNLFSDNGSGADSDPNGDPFTVSEINGDPTRVGEPLLVTSSSGRQGLLTVLPDGTWSFDPQGNFNDLSDGEPDTVTFDYTITDAHGFTDPTPASVTITVTGTNDPPLVTAIMDSVGEDGPSFTADLLADALAVDPDVDGTAPDDTLTVQNADSSIVTLGGRTLIEDVDYTITGSALALTAAGFAQFNSLTAIQDDSFVLNYQISDGTAAVANTLTVTVNGEDDAPFEQILPTCVTGPNAFAGFGVDVSGNNMVVGAPGGTGHVCFY